MKKRCRGAERADRDEKTGPGADQLGRTVETVTREQKYIEQLREIGVYQPAFDPEIHMLAMMEREHQRTVKAWRAAGSPISGDLCQAVERQRRDILQHRDALGLTPKGLHRLRPSLSADSSHKGQISVLNQIRARRMNEDN